jgi:hypothetical protein
MSASDYLTQWLTDGQALAQAVDMLVPVLVAAAALRVVILAVSPPKRYLG